VNVTPAHDTLSAIASSPDAVAASSAMLFAAIDAVANVYSSTDTSRLTPRQAAMRTPAATWAAILAHAEHRLAQLKAAQR
jgi:hypothetical protein